MCKAEINIGIVINTFYSIINRLMIREQPLLATKLANLSEFYEALPISDNKSSEQ